MTRMLSAAFAALALCAAVPSADAATYDFSFSNVEGPVSGAVAGYIVLGDGDGTFAATSLIVTAAPVALGYTLDFDVLANFTDVVANSFTVSGGVINAGASSFAAQDDFGLAGLALNFGTGFFGSLLSLRSGGGVSSGIVDLNNATLAYASADVPLPAAAPLLIAGLGGLALLGRRRRA